MFFNGYLKPVGLFIKHNKSHILTAAAVVFSVFAVIDAIKSTSDAKDIIDEAEYEKFESLGCPEDEDVDYHLTRSEVIKNVWKCYIWTALLLGGAVTCCVASHIESNKTIGAMTLAYGSLLETYNTYRDSTQKLLTEKELRDINHSVVHDIVEADKAKMPVPVKNNLLTVTDETQVLFRDIYSSNTGRCYFKKTMEEVRRAEGRFNRIMMDHGVGTLNDWYDCLDIGHSDIGDFMGWRWEETGPLFAAAVPDDIDIVEDVAVVTGLGLARDQYTKYFEMPNRVY